MIAPNRIYAQYRDKPKIRQWFNITPTLGAELETAFNDVAHSYDIDDAEGEQLNVIGRIVGIDRSFESQISFEVTTQYGGTNNASTWGGLGAQYQTTGRTISGEVSDAIFKTLIKAKIAKNNSPATLDGVCEALRYITNVDIIRVIDNEDMTFSVSFGQQLDPIAREVFNTFDVVPRPQGVQFSGYTEETEITIYGGRFGWGDSRADYGQFFGV